MTSCCTPVSTLPMPNDASCTTTIFLGAIDFDRILIPAVVFLHSKALYALWLYILDTYSSRFLYASSYRLALLGLVTNILPLSSNTIPLNSGVFMERVLPLSCLVSLLVRGGFSSSGRIVVSILSHGGGVVSIFRSIV